jgi:hypothetical protein
MPLTRGHVLLVTRNHYEKLKDMGVEVSREVSISSNLLPRGYMSKILKDAVAQIGQWLPIISRVVMRTVFDTEAESDWSWNIVQNNGTLSVHFG